MSFEASLFSNYWHLIAHASELPRDRDFVVYNILDEEIVLCNDGGSWFAFDNICPHRGARIFSSEFGNRGIACGYHGWTYRRGELKIPKSREFSEELIRKCRYNTYSVELCGSFIFVAKKPKITLREQLGEVFKTVNDISDSISGRCDFNRYLFECSWLTCVENALESYHVDVVHSKTLGRMSLINQKDVQAGVNSFVTFDVDNKKTKLALNLVGKYFSLPYKFSGYSSLFLYPFTFISSTYGYSYAIQTFFPKTRGETWFTSRLLKGKVADISAGGEVLDDIFSSTAQLNRRVFEEDHAICRRVRKVWPDCDDTLLGAGEVKIRWFHDALRRDELTSEL
jgi:phenylpropionate dioxygenase-like ring-hydroxylating dioxygenase large terminal subunit